MASLLRYKCEHHSSICGLSEKLADVLNGAIKYGEGDEEVLTILNIVSQNIRVHEFVEKRHLEIMSSDDDDEEGILQEGPRLSEIMRGRSAIVMTLNAIGEVIPRMKGSKDGLSN